MSKGRAKPVEGLYGVRFSMDELPFEEDPEREYVSKVSGSIRFQSLDWAHDGSVSVGSVTGLLIRVDRAVTDGVPLLRACDLNSRDALDYAKAVWDPKNEKLKPEVSEQLGQPIYGNIIIVHEVEVKPAHRGHDVGLGAAGRLVATFGGGCSIAMGLPSPLQHSSRRGSEAWTRRFRPDLFVADRSAGVAKLARHWSRLGFQQLTSSRYLAMSMDAFLSQKKLQRDADHSV